MKLMDIANFITYGGKKREQPQAPIVVTHPEDIYGENKVLLSWKADSRPVKKAFNQKFIRTGIVIGVVVALLLAMMQEFFLILVVVSVVFISYVLSNAPIEVVENELTTHGVKTAGQFFYWHELKKSSDVELLAVDVLDKLPGRLFLSFSQDDRVAIKEIFAKHITYVEEEPLTAIDKLYFRFLDKFNFDRK